MLQNQFTLTPLSVYNGGDNLTTGDFGTPHVLVAARVLVDAADPRDVTAVNAMQDQLGLDASSARPFVMPDYDQASLKATRDALMELAKGLSGYEHAFGAKNEVDPVRHLIGTAAAWGGLPDREATYLNVSPNLPAAEYQLTVRDVPVDGFWSISLYNAKGYFQPNDRGAYTVNNITAIPDHDSRSPSASAAAPMDGPTACRSWMAGTTWSAYTARAPRSSTAPGPSPPSRQPPDARPLTPRH